MRYRRVGWRALATAAAAALLVSIAGPAGPPAARAAAGPSWHVTTLGNPVPAATQIMPIGAVSVQLNATDSQRPHMFNVIDGNVWVTWWNGSGWTWTNLHAPPSGSPIVGTLGVVTVQDRTDLPTRPYAYVYTADGRLWFAWSDGARWSWHALGAPPGTTVAAAAGVVGVQDSPDRPHRPYAFVLGADGNLWLNWWNGSQFRWENMGTPQVDAFSNPSSRNRVGVTNWRHAETSPDHPQVFLLDAQRNLWRMGWHGSAWAWTNHGRPPTSLRPTTGNGAISVQSVLGAERRPYAFVGVNGLLYALAWTGTQWAWTPTGGPGGVSLTAVGAVAVRDSNQDTPQSAQRPYVFTTDLEGGPLSASWTDYTGTWYHAQQQGTNASPLSSVTGAITVRDTPRSPDRPYVFYWSYQGMVNPQPANLMLNWWG